MFLTCSYAASSMFHLNMLYVRLAIYSFDNTVAIDSHRQKIVF